MSAGREHRMILTHLVPLALFLFIGGTLIAPSAFAHTFTRSDGNDTRGLLDLKAASVKHVNDNLVFTVTAFSRWRKSQLERDSYFLIGLDRDDDTDLDRCAVIYYYGGRLRGAMTNCGRRTFTLLPVSKPNLRSARVTLHEDWAGGDHRWAAFSVWVHGSACRNGCVDSVPNRLPLLFHDLTEPTISPLLPAVSTDVSATPTFSVTFSVSDPGGSGIASWALEQQLDGSTTWAPLAAGTVGGPQSVEVVGSEGLSAVYRVTATDRHGNVATTASPIAVPVDDDSMGAFASFSGVTPETIVDPDAYGGTLTSFASGGALSIAYTDCRTIWFVASGADDWAIDVHLNGSPQGNYAGHNFDDVQRQLIFTASTILDGPHELVIASQGTDPATVDGVAIGPEGYCSPY